ncbi:Voltage-gated Ion Channel (VIC) Superfamily, partial [Thraustotheca clavata]
EFVGVEKIEQPKIPMPNTVIKLKLHHGKLTMCPFSSLPDKLSELDMSDNKLTVIQASSLPSTLATLNLGWNQITELNDVSLPNLNTLNLDLNPLMLIANLYAPSLTNFSCFQCNLSTFSMNSATYDALNKLSPPPSLRFDTSSCSGSIKSLWGMRACVSEPKSYEISFRSSPQASNTKEIIIIIAGGIGAVVFLAICLFILCRFRRRRQELKKAARENDAAYILQVNDIQTMRDIDQLSGIRVPLQEVVVLDRLSTDDLWKGLYQGQVVSIRYLFNSNSTTSDMKAGIQQVLVATRLESRYIVSLYGASWTTPKDLMLVLEFMDMGDLQTYLSNLNSAQITWKYKAKCFQQIVHAIAYLHTTASFVHGHVSAQNILLDGAKGAKLMMLDTHVSKNASFRYTAPEVLRGEPYSLPADIYSLGLLLSEMDTHEVPYGRWIDHENWEDEEEKRLMQRIIDGEATPTFTPECPEWIVEIFNRGRTGSGTRHVKSVRGRQLWDKVRENLTVIVPPKPAQQYHRVVAPPFMFDPESDIKIKWDLVIAACVVYTTAVVPYRVTFSIDAVGFFALLESAMDCAFFVDIIFSFRTGVINPNTGLAIYKKKQIAKSYVKGWFFIDFISTIPIATVATWLLPQLKANALMTTGIFRGLKLARLLKLARMHKISRMVSKWEEEAFANQSLLSLLKILFFVFFLAHIVACVWFYTATTNSYSWASVVGYLADDHAHKQYLQYLASLYWAIVTMATVGYGDIVPKTKQEVIFAMFVMVIGVVMFGFVIGNITALVDNLSASSRMHSQRMTSIKEYIIARDISKEIGKQLLDHYEYYYRHRSVFDEDSILQHLPSVIRHEVVHHVYRKFIARIDFLSEFHEGLVSDMAIAMNPFFVTKEQGIYMQHEIAAHVFFLMKGTAVLLKTYTSQLSEVHLMQIGPGMHFGEVELYHPRYGRGVRLCSAIAKTYCELTFISRQVIASIGETWPEILSHFERSGFQKVRAMSKRGPLDDFNASATKLTKGKGVVKRRNSLVGRVLQLTRKGGMLLPPRRSSIDLAEGLCYPDDGTNDCIATSSDEDDLVQTVSNPKQLDDQLLRYSVSRPVLNERKLAHKNWVLHPEEALLINWQLIIAIAIVYSTIVVPYRIGFKSDATGLGLVFDLFVDSLFFTDILIAFQTAYYTSERTLVVNKRTIMFTYLKGWFMIDFISTLPIDTIGGYFIANSSQVLSSTKILRFLRIARIFKLIRLLKIGKVFKRVRDAIQLSPSSERLLKLITIIFLFGHWNGCVFHFIMLQEEDFGLRTWCTEYFFPLDEDPGLCSNRVALIDRYLASLYWAFTTMTTVGYGDIHPYRFSVAEIMFAIFCLLLNSTVFAYVVSGIIEVIYNYDPSDREYKFQLYAMKDYVRDSSLSIRLSTNVRQHYNFLLSTVCLFPEEKIFNQLRPSLRFDVARRVASNSILMIDLIATMEKRYKGFVSYAMFLLKPQYVLRSECICHSGTPGSEMYFIVEGECEQLDKDCRNGRILCESAIVEAYALLASPSEHYRTESTVTVLTKSCQLYAFAVQDFRKIAALSPAISSNMSYELARSIIQDDFLRLNDVQEKTIAAAIENERRNNPEANDQMNNLANVVMVALKQTKN